jgi:hypothetical protein
MSEPKEVHIVAEQERQAASRCPECGAPNVNGMNCWEQLAAILGWESQDPELAAEHFLTVASYNLQHPAQFTDEALAGLRIAFIDRLDRGVPPHVLRQRAASAYNGKKRVLRRESERQHVLRQWRMTIAEVYLPDQPQEAAERVRRWAAAIRSEL